MTGDSEVSSVAATERGAEVVSYAPEPAELGPESVDSAERTNHGEDIAGLEGEPEEFGEVEEARSGEDAALTAEAHPALAGLPRGVDEDGNEVVEFQGAWVAPEFVVDLYEQGQRLQQVAELERAEAAKGQAEQEQLLGEFEQAAMDLLSDSRRRAFPELPEEQGALLDELLLPYADRMLASMDWEGLDEEGLLTQMDKAGQDLMGRVRDLFTLAAAQQPQDNTHYAETHRVRPEGTPGTPCRKARIWRAICACRRRSGGASCSARRRRRTRCRRGVARVFKTKTEEELKGTAS